MKDSRVEVICPSCKKPRKLQAAWAKKAKICRRCRLDEGCPQFSKPRTGGFVRHDHT